MGKEKFKIDCPGCNEKFKTKQEFEGHKCSIQVKQEVFVDVDEIDGEGPSITTQNPKYKYGTNESARNKIPPEDDIDPLSINNEETFGYDSEETRPPGIDHETIRSLVLKVDPKQALNADTADYSRQFNCRLCHRTFDGSNSFTEHFKSVHKHYRPYECSICGKKFLQKHYVTLHMRVHTGERPYKCQLCPRTYSHKTSYVIHMRIHNGIRPFRCNVCGKRCYDKSGLTSHMRSHTKETPYACKVCDRKFTHSKSLLVHYRNHTGEKPYKCDYCGKAFRHWHKHKIHVRLHTGERPYRCTICGKGFPRNDEVNRHMKSHTGIKSFKCSICDVYCATQASITGHINLHHSNLQTDDQPEKTLVTGSNSGILGKAPINLPTTLNNLKIISAEKTDTPTNETSSGSNSSITRVIEINSKEEAPLPTKRKSGRVLCDIPNRPDEEEKPMTYKEFLEWQEKMLIKQGLVVKRYPNDEDPDKSKTTSPTISSSEALPSTSGQMLRKALTGNNADIVQSIKDSGEKPKTQYILISQPGNPSSKILVPVNVTSSGAKPPSASSDQTPAIVQPPLSSKPTHPIPMPSSVQAPTIVQQPSNSNSDKSKQLLLVPQSLSSQSFVIVQNGKMLLMTPAQAGANQLEHTQARGSKLLPTQAGPIQLSAQSSITRTVSTTQLVNNLPSAGQVLKDPLAIQNYMEQTSPIDESNGSSNIPHVSVKMDPDPLSDEISTSKSLLLDLPIKQEPIDDSLDAIIKREPESD